MNTNQISKRNLWIACLCIVIVLICFAIWDLSQYSHQQEQEKIVSEDDDSKTIIEFNHNTASTIEVKK